MRKVLKLISFALVLTLSFSLIFTGCGNKTEIENTSGSTAESTSAPEKTVTDNGIDISKEVNLTGYLLGDRLAGMDDVMVQLNEKLKKDVNATMEINYIGWGDVASKYPLVLASGENVDWVFAANWNYYAQEANKGAFYEINEEMLQKYMPKHYTATNKVAWKEALVNGKLYMIPTSTPDKKVAEFAIRQDLAKKYGVPEITNFTGIDPYLEAIKKNEPNMVPMNLDNTYDLGKPFYATYTEMKGYWDLLAATTGGSGVYTDFEDPEGKIFKITDVAALPDFKAAAARVKAYYDKGYINKNAFSNKVRSKDSFEQGKSAVAFGNTNDMQSTITKGKAMGWEVKIIPLLTKNGHYPADPYLNNGVAIAAKTPNPERTMMALDLIMEDPDYGQLVYYGVEGKNYVTKEGKIALPDGIAADKNTYPPDASGFWFTNKDLLKPQVAWDDAYIKLREDAKTQVSTYVYAAFSPDTTKIKTEVANLNQVLIQYMNPIILGISKDIDADFATLDDKLTKAGIDKVLTEMKAQTDAFRSSTK